MYQLIATEPNGHTNDQGTPVNPASVTYNALNNEAVLLFAANLNSYAPPGTNSLRLRVGDFNEPITTTTLTATEGEAGTTYATAMPLPSSELGSGPQSLVISNQIEALSYDLQWPGGPTDPGDRNLPAQPDVYYEATHSISHLGRRLHRHSYLHLLFPDHLRNGHQRQHGRKPDHACQEQRTRETPVVLLLLRRAVRRGTGAPGGTLYGGDAIAVCTGNLYPMNKAVSAPGGIMGIGGNNNGHLMAVMDGADSATWGTSNFGGAWQQVAMHEIMHCLGFGHSFDLPPDQIMGDDITQGTSELTLPGMAI